MARIEKPNYTQVPNVLIDNHLRDLSEADLKVMLFILRKTVGYHKENITISLSSIADAIGMNRSSASRSCQSLCDLGILVSRINSTDDGSRSATTYEVDFIDDPSDHRVAPTQHRVALAPLGGVAPTQPYKEERKQEEIKQTVNSPLPLSEIRTPVDENSIRWINQRWVTFAGRKLTTAEKRQFVEWLGEVDYSEEQIEFALKLFFMDTYWREKKFPPKAFQKRCGEYLDRTESRPAPPGSGVLPESGGAVPSQNMARRASGGAGEAGARREDGRDTPHPNGTVLGLAIRDELLERYIGTFLAAGASIGDFEREQMQVIWNTLDVEQKYRSCQDALVICERTEPKYLSMAAHLKKKPWTRVTLDRRLQPANAVQDKNALAREILRKKLASK